ncbi:MAG: biosynthetic-type acetolactate synthase large subunit [Candidatus Parabeggiatoa sp. nov. 3]|nr:MAG: biosynthetic-type acetolactate synthase large subunit [Gammaproteobacteria bacterium]RKZ66914.1 MAG: biosynthetic-type acetolactate synthase large subunit [Gammaproteobacteria bacterium]RKZ79768.1 MAG: biosynthetic-type acetolactate synthase large subunit [Gammaproteobacteria bacterium]
MNEANQAEMMTGADIFVNALIAEGVEHVFGFPGGAVLHIYDAIFKQDKFQHILVRHEQGAVHAADGYARSSGKPGVALLTSGPGATNGITGIATAYLDSTPLVVFTGQVPTSLIGNDAFQEVDSVGISRPCVKHNFLVKDVGELAITIKKAFYIATTGRPGPVLVDIPKDVTANRALFEYPKTIEMRSYKPVVVGESGQIRRAAEMILSAKRPVIYSGGGVVLSNGSQELIEFTRLLGYPITQTLMGLGAYPATDPQFIGMLGMHGTYEANMAMYECDTLIAIGARFDDRVTGELEKFCPDAKIVHLDIDPSSISKNVKVDIPLVGTVDRVLQDLIQVIKEMGRKPDSDALATWWGQIDTWRATDCLRYDRNNELIKPQFVVEKLHELTQGNAFVTSDVGQHQMFAAQFYKFNQPRHWINSGGLGTMGFGLPAAMGVQIAHPNDTVVCITGEGSIQMCIQELSTCKQYDLPIKIIMLNNRYLGMVRQWQEFFYDKRYSHTYIDALPDFMKLADSYGHVGMRIEKPSEVEGALKEALAIKESLVFMDFLIDQGENVYPMIAAGKGHNEMLLSPERELA